MPAASLLVLRGPGPAQGDIRAPTPSRGPRPGRAGPHFTHLHWGAHGRRGALLSGGRFWWEPQLPLHVAKIWGALSLCWKENSRWDRQPRLSLNCRRLVEHSLPSSRSRTSARSHAGERPAGECPGPRCLGCEPRGLMWRLPWVSQPLPHGTRAGLWRGGSPSHF